MPLANALATSGSASVADTTSTPEPPTDSTSSSSTTLLGSRSIPSLLSAASTSAWLVTMAFAVSTMASDSSAVVTSGPK